MRRKQMLLLALLGIGCGVWLTRHAEAPQPPPLPSAGSASPGQPPPLRAGSDQERRKPHGGAPQRLAHALGVDAATLPTAGEPLPSPLTGVDRDNVLVAAETLVSGQGGASQAAIDTLASFGDQALVTMADELRRGNVFGQDDRAVRRRLTLVDALGKAAFVSPLALAELEDFIGTPLDWSKPRPALHADVLDRLEAFEFVAAIEPEFARRFLMALPEGRLRQKFAKHLIVGFRLAGLEEPAAVNRAYALLAPK